MRFVLPSLVAFASATTLAPEKIPHYFDELQQIKKMEEEYTRKAAQVNANAEIQADSKPKSASSEMLIYPGIMGY
jgi:hypothetical protein